MEYFERKYCFYIYSQGICKARKEGTVFFFLCACLAYYWSLFEPPLYVCNSLPGLRSTISQITQSHEDPKLEYKILVLISTLIML
jgi:hypothetical protein